MGHEVGQSFRLTVEDRCNLVDRVRAGQTFGQAAAAVGCSTKAIQRLLMRNGGIKPRLRSCPSVRRCS